VLVALIVLAAAVPLVAQGRTLVQARRRERALDPGA
jgi:hypothetical protein